jgi:hypothetical protein
VHNVLYIWESWISEAVLVLRVLVVIKSYRTAQKAALLAFPVVIKAVRAAVTIVFLHRWRLKTMHAAVNIVSITKLSGSWPVKTGWILEIFDNGCVNALCEPNK